jgi:hypothetical protein
VRRPHIRICRDDFASYDEAQSEGDYRIWIFSITNCPDFLPGENEEQL